jgi:D-glycero-alpha-D-manno-heptose 1-phosphate guanylyltransferase
VQAIVLAGGLGTRLRPVVPDLPKPMAPVDGRPFLEHLLDYWIGQGVSRAVLAVGHLHAVIERHFQAQYRKIPLVYAVEESPLGTGGGLLGAVKLLAEQATTLVLNGDTFFAVPLDDLVNFHRVRHANFTLGLFASGRTQRYDEVVLDGDGRIRSLGAGLAGGSGFANGGVYLLERPAEFAGRWPGARQISLEREILPDEIARGAAVYGLRSHAGFIDIGVPEDYARAAGVLQSQRLRGGL